MRYWVSTARALHTHSLSLTHSKNQRIDYDEDTYDVQKKVTEKMAALVDKEKKRKAKTEVGSGEGGGERRGGGEEDEGGEERSKAMRCDWAAAGGLR